MAAASRLTQRWDSYAKASRETGCFPRARRPTQTGPKGYSVPSDVVLGGRSWGERTKKKGGRLWLWHPSVARLGAGLALRRDQPAAGERVSCCRRLNGFA